MNSPVKGMGCLFDGSQKSYFNVLSKEGVTTT